jgi:YbbR domain-containing protein
MYVTSELNPIRNYDVVNIPVKIVNAEALGQLGLIMMKSEDTTKLTIKGRSKDVLAAKSTDFKAEADLSGYRVKGNNSVLVNILDHPKNVEVPPQPIYITVELDELVEKAFPITVKPDINYKEGYIATTPAEYSPKEAILRGASRYIGSVNTVSASYSVKDVAADIKTSIPIQVLDKSGNSIKEIEVNPKAVDITLDVQRAKQVQVNLRQTGKLPSGVYMKSIAVTPDKITLIGDEGVINGIKSIDTEYVSLDDVTANVTKIVKLNLPPGVKTSDGSTSVSVDISVEGTISKAFNIPVNPVNLVSELNADLLTNTISVTLSGRESEINNLISANITAVVDLAGVVEGEHDLTPKITAPQGFEIKDISPSKIKVKITRKQG